MRQDERWLHDELSRTKVPIPPLAMRQNVLDVAMRVEPERPRVWERLWLSSTARVAWAATVVGLFLFNAVASGMPMASPARAPRPPEAAEFAAELSRYATSRSRDMRSDLLAELLRELDSNSPAVKAEQESHL